MVANWIHEENRLPFLETLAFLAGYDFNDYDWAGISYGLEGTDDEHDKWYEYPFRGVQTLILQVATTPGASEDVWVRVEGEHGDLSPELAARIEMLLIVCQEYKLAPFH